MSGFFTPERLIEFCAELMIILLILPLHEYAHAWTAYKLGDDTASRMGRMTLNPLAHLDPIGAILMLLTGFGWAKPVPIDPSRFSRKHSMRFGVAVTAAAGPISNLLAALVGMLGLRFYMISPYYQNYVLQAAAGGAGSMDTPLIIYYFIYYFISVNIGLAVFNLLPVPPLDGSKVIGYFTSARVEQWVDRNYGIIRIVFLVLIFSGILSVPLGYLRGWVMRFFFWITGWIPRLFG